MTGFAALWRDPRVRTGLGILGCVSAAAVAAPLVPQLDPLTQPDVLRTRFLPPLTLTSPSGPHWLGTDELGRDLLARLLWGARISLAVGLASVSIAVVLGVAVGTTAALTGGRTDRWLMAITDAALAMPRIVLLLALVAVSHPSLGLVVAVLSLTGWMGIARLVRAEIRALLGRPFVEAARAAGAPPLRLVLRHLLPNALTPVIAAAALGVGNAIMLEAGLSFLGLGIPAPAPSWGNLIAGGRDALVNAPWIATLPGVAVATTVVACTLVGDGLRDALDPRVRSTLL